MGVSDVDIINFWFEELKPSDQFRKNPEIDLRIKNRFYSTLDQALRGELFSWRASDLGRLAEIIVLDQFSRNIFRDDPRSFAGDSIALVLAQEAVAKGIDQKVDLRQRTFLYMPYMHSESLVIHQEAVKLFAQPGLEYNYDFEIKHKQIIDKFGRFPHRNKVLGRTSTPEEIEFLKGPNSSF
jgi:uncharacterized protein (DUF924 family)